MEYSKGFRDVVYHPDWKDEFIGYGNPNATILIIGQEAALEPGTDGWKRFYVPNQKQWLDTMESGYTYRNGYESNGNDYNFPAFFNPVFPFYKQKFFRLTKTSKTKDGTSSTYYNYQKLINAIIPHDQETDPRLGEIIDFFRYSFVTELNSECRLNHTTQQPSIIENIARRFDKMKATKSFWSGFRNVILACGSYADAIKKDENLKKAIFGDANVIFTRQLSIMSSAELSKIVSQIK